MTDPTAHLGAHPGDERLACYVDGTLSASERAAVARHLDTCAHCRAEVVEATAARAALAQLETAPAPAGLADHALAASATQKAAAPTGTTPRWHRWGGAAAVAAGFALLLVLVVPRLGDNNASTARIGAAARRGPVTIEVSDQNFQPASVRRLATDFAAGTPDAVGDAAASIIPSEVPAVAPAESVGSHPKVVTASTCVKKAFRQVNGTLARLIQARFEGQPAYLAVYTEGSVAGQPDDTVKVRVAAIDGCTPLTIAGAPLLAPSP